MSAWAYIALAVTFAAQAVGTMVIYAPAVLAPAAQADIGVSGGSVGGLTSISYLGATVATVLSARAIASFGALRWSQISLLFSGLGMALIASANLWLVMLGAIVVGVGYGPLTPASSTILVRHVPERLRATILSVKQSGVPAGGVLAGLLIPALIALFGWRVAALALGAICAVLAAAIQPARAGFDRTEPGSRTASRQSLIEPIRLLWSHRRLRELGCVAFMYSGIQMMFVSFFVVYLTQRVGLSLVSAGSAMAAGMAGGVIARVAWGIVADRLVEPRVLLGWIGIGTSISTLALATVGADWPLASVYAVGIAMGVTSVGWNGVLIAELAHAAPHGNVGGATGAGLMFAYAGVVCVPGLCSAAIVLTGSYEATFALVATANAWVALLPLRR